MYYCIAGFYRQVTRSTTQSAFTISKPKVFSRYLLTSLTASFLGFNTIDCSHNAAGSATKKRGVVLRSYINTPKNNLLTLSSLKGKVVLVYIGLD
jgi:hypothetical protein